MNLLQFEKTFSVPPLCAEIMLSSTNPQTKFIQKYNTFSKTTPVTIFGITCRICTSIHKIFSRLTSYEQLFFILISCSYSLKTSTYSNFLPTFAVYHIFTILIIQKMPWFMFMYPTLLPTIPLILHISNFHALGLHSNVGQFRITKIKIFHLL